MYPIEFPWWFVLVMYFVIFLLYGGIGILVGCFFAYLLTTRDRPKGNSYSGSQRFTFLLVGGLLGGAVQYTVVSTYVSSAW